MTRFRPFDALLNGPGVHLPRAVTSDRRWVTVSAPVVVGEAADAAANTVVGARLRELRRTRGVRQETLAAECGISASYLSRIEAGERHAGPPLLDRLAAALG